MSGECTDGQELILGEKEDSTVELILGAARNAVHRECFRRLSMCNSSDLVDAAGSRMPLALSGPSLAWFFRLLTLLASHPTYMVDMESIMSNSTEQALADAHRLLVMRIASMARFIGGLADALSCEYIREQALVFKNAEIERACSFLLGDSSTDNMMLWTVDVSKMPPPVLRLIYATGIAVNAPNTEAVVGGVLASIMIHSTLVEFYYGSPMGPLEDEDGTTDPELLTMYCMMREVCKAVKIVTDCVKRMQEMSCPPMQIVLAGEFIKSTRCDLAEEKVNKHIEEMEEERDNTASPVYWAEASVKAMETMNVNEHMMFFHVELPHPCKLSEADYQGLQKECESNGGDVLFHILGTQRRILTDVLTEESRKTDISLFLRLVLVVLTTITMDICEDAALLYAHLTKASLAVLDECVLTECRSRLEAMGAEGNIRSLYVTDDVKGTLLGEIGRPIDDSPLFYALPDTLAGGLCHAPTIDSVLDPLFIASFGSSFVTSELSLDDKTTGGTDPIDELIGVF